MKITIVMGAFMPMPPAGFGAVERVWQGLARQYARLGHHVTIVCKAASGESNEEIIDGVAYLRMAGFKRTKHLAFDLAKDLAYSMGVLRALPQADILVSNTFWVPVVAPLFRSSAGRVVVHVARAPKGQYWLYRYAARFDTVSNHIQERVSASSPSLASKVRTFPNPIDTTTLSPSRDEGLKRKGETIVYLGRLHPEKGVHVLVDAFRLVAARNAEARLRLIGPWREEDGGGGAEYLEALQNASRGLPVEFSEPISDLNLIADALRHAKLFCYPSLAERGEAFGLAPLEAMATGLVSVVSDLKPFRDYLKHGQNGMVFDHRGPLAARNLATQLNDALADPERLARLSMAAVVCAQSFSYDRVAQMRLRDYEELLREPN